MATAPNFNLNPANLQEEPNVVKKTKIWRNKGRSHRRHTTIGQKCMICKVCGRKRYTGSSNFNEIKVASLYAYSETMAKKGKTVYVEKGDHCCPRHFLVREYPNGAVRPPNFSIK